MNSSHVVVDGSNLATEGRTLPSLSQLEEAIAAYEDEHPGAELIVVVDATFEHRIDEKDRERFKAIELNGELTAPPAGAVGRGDAFILLIAKKMDAIVLSNDSFQEFHGEHPWLFEEGRLIGGKPVPGVGWIFTPRNPVRGPKSRASTKASAKKAGPVKKLSVTRPDGSKPKLGDTLTPLPPEPVVVKNVRVYELAKQLGVENKEVLALAAKQKVAAASHSSSLTPEDAEKIRSALANRKVRADALAEELGFELKALKDLAKANDVKIASPATPVSASDADRLRAAAARTAARADATAQAVAVAEATKPDDDAAEPSGRRRRRRRRSGGQEPTGRADEAPTKRSEAATSSLVNEPLDLVTFLATHGVGTQLDGTVASFTSHGAMVEVALGFDRSFHCYVRTVNLGDPPPSKARDVVRKGETYRFEVLEIDAGTRVAELRLAPAAPAPPLVSEPAAEPAAPPSRDRRSRGAASSSAATPTTRAGRSVSKATKAAGTTKATRANKATKAAAAKKATKAAAAKKATKAAGAIKAAKPTKVTTRARGRDGSS
jgi:hypothetical protein